ncbi:hypothetical protein [Citrobacter amalonaticus]|uniref:Uncharacterized protein n=1 Tax=uncultured Citrobacter sp. TaxID=200446 RepID=A0A212I3D7_9ENTR|nr:hypothetical protein [Citrobacter amalonaticus]SAZ33925.1 protein of unknown function [Citrobacter amalonaticus]SBV61254.1 hypothetical protein KM92CIT3_120046 [uncultured Citrobacter sp.]
MTVHTLKQCRPDQEETEYFWKLFHASQRNDARWHGSEISIIADELSRTDLDRNQKLFLLRAWQVLVDDKGGFGRFMGAFDTYVYNMQDPDDDCVAWKPELSRLLQDGTLFDVVLTAYQEACHEGSVNWEAAVSLSEENVELKRKLYAAENRIAELEAEKAALRPVGVMSQRAFHRLEHSESRFIALWPRPGIYLPRKRPDDGVIVYARTAAGIGKGE